MLLLTSAVHDEERHTVALDLDKDLEGRPHLGLSKHCRDMRLDAGADGALGRKADSGFSGELAEGLRRGRPRLHGHLGEAKDHCNSTLGRSAAEESQHERDGVFRASEIAGLHAALTCALDDGLDTVGRAEVRAELERVEERRRKLVALEGSRHAFMSE